eukprot:1160224-Pelagomonas_calceolata.AAC.17
MQATTRSAPAKAVMHHNQNVSGLGSRVGKHKAPCEVTAESKEPRDLYCSSFASIASSAYRVLSFPACCFDDHLVCQRRSSNQI